MKTYYTVGLLGAGAPAIRQGLDFLLASFRYHRQTLQARAEITPALQGLLVIGTLTPEEYHWLYHEQHLPTLIWGNATLPTPKPRHIHTLAQHAGGGQLIQRLDEIIGVHRTYTVGLPEKVDEPVEKTEAL